MTQISIRGYVALIDPHVNAATDLAEHLINRVLMSGKRLSHGAFRCEYYPVWGRLWTENNSGFCGSVVIRA